jgi:hypothetical protein
MTQLPLVCINKFGFCLTGQRSFHVAFSRPRRLSTMATNSQRPGERSGVVSTLNVTIDALDLAEETSSITPAKAVFGSVSILLTMIKVRFPPPATTFRLTFNQKSMTNEQDYVDLGLNCADICRALDRGTNGKKPGDLGQSVCEAINQLTT